MHIFYVCVFIMSLNNKTITPTDSDMTAHTASEMNENVSVNTVKMSKVLCVEIKVI
jgi:hypothetical protein